MTDIKDKMLDTREQLIEILKKELIGPGSEISMPDEGHELISSAPEQRYSMGILFPRGQHFNAENNDSEVTGNNISDNGMEVEEESGVEDTEQSEKGAAANPGDDEGLDEEVSLATQNMPASMGISFIAEGDVSHINCSITFATYRKATASDCRVPMGDYLPDGYSIPEEMNGWIWFDNDEKTIRLTRGGFTYKVIRELMERVDTDEYDLKSVLYKLSTQLQRGYVREPHAANETVSFIYSDYVDENRNICDKDFKLTALRRQLTNNRYAVTLMLVNNATGKPSGSNCIFQPLIAVSSDNNTFTFCEYAGLRDFNSLDDEEKSLELQYRNKKVYASGLGVSVDWNVDENGKGTVKSSYYPIKEVPAMSFDLPSRYDVNSKVLSMKYLSDLNDIEKSEKLSLLRSFVTAYKSWIDELKEKSKELEKIFQITAKCNIEGCEKACKRMFEGIDALESNDFKWQSFMLANRAMFMQRAHIKLQQNAEDKYPGDNQYGAWLERIDYYNIDKIVSDRYAWRPFQLAFLLLSIESITEDNSLDRGIIDLIWFTTGGGKTEAYLGLTAFTIFYRRLNHRQDGGGTAVMMRYTLRLLTAQQFTRAATLICACEFIRQDSLGRKPVYKAYPLGKEEITIGLWIGQEHTPNTNADAEKSLRELLHAHFSNIDEAQTKYNKFQVLKCPWCGTKLIKEKKERKLIGQFGYRMNRGNHFELYCPQEDCFFERKLPIQIVDEELYASPPTLLFGTVDKFAMFPFKEEIGRYFGLGTDNRPPELIIQDELHLISGPLGTMVGMYETIIDYLTEYKGVKSKIIASTATIRRAREQCSALYGRTISQFPHPGIDAEDSFFAREAIIDYSQGKYGRKYVGLIPSGKTKAMMEIRTLASILQRTGAMDLPDEVKDKYWTVTVYFNSLKELGKCATLVDDDVKDAIRRTARRMGHDVKIRRTYRADELTSRVNTSTLNRTLDKLEKLDYSQVRIERKEYASDVVLATNMISVGIDVARLNVMLLVGQPKLTSEYIQASSRIGREYPGVAFVLYDGSKSRDRSHYEQFKAYHDSFYKAVEPTGVTPFSKPARDRALHAACISLMRQVVPELRPENSASEFTVEKYEDIIQKIKSFIVKRDRSIIERLNSGMTDDSGEIAEEIDMIFERWESLARNYEKDHFFYGQKFLVKHPDEKEGRLMKPFGTDDRDLAMDTMTSMRNVDTAVRGNVLVWEEESDES